MHKYVSPQLRDLNFFNINILTNHHVLLGEEWTFEHSIAPYSRLYYVKDGHATIFFDDKVIEMLPENVYLIPPNVEISYKCEKDSFLEKIYFHFIAPTFEKYDLLSTLPYGVYAISLDEANARKLFSVYCGNSYLNILEVNSIIYQTVVAFLKKYQQGDTEIRHYSETVREALNYIQNRYSANFNIQTMADSLFVSKSKISSYFKNETGMTISQYNEYLLFNRAEILLSNKRFSIRQISDILGFCDQFYFSRRFKKIFGKSPQQYRKNKLIL